MNILEKKYFSNYVKLMTCYTNFTRSSVRLMNYLNQKLFGHKKLSANYLDAQWLILLTALQENEEEMEKELDNIMTKNENVATLLGDTTSGFMLKHNDKLADAIMSFYAYLKELDIKEIVGESALDVLDFPIKINPDEVKDEVVESFNEYLSTLLGYKIIDKIERGTTTEQSEFKRIEQYVAKTYPINEERKVTSSTYGLLDVVGNVVRPIRIKTIPVGATLSDENEESLDEE